ncbi:carbonic anhydrase [Methylocystis bryophila]|uniref:Carbonic anhydrase n=1 Tax=Methylocystis bryophila TaxID=655015 RepID=A0A1W6MXW6_9HYPH|nr:carbonic anhydrase [Methylocystis bryophila]ARN82389.1 carbonic anhydrase [Methylocystis bryophila]BDV38561.1 carbonic anhydrase [Methylocystis bryophila]
MQSYEKLLLENKAWAAEKKEREPEFFVRLSAEQKPEFLWIGCSDSRVPADIIVNAEPGLIFAHRNIANQVIATDFNSLSVIQYAVQVLKVRHIIVCGHYNCGGVRAALDRPRADLSMLNKWLTHVKDIYRLHRHEIDALASIEAKADRLVELNVIEQVRHLSHNSIVQTAWRDNGRPTLHGWVYGFDDGVLKQLITLPPGGDIDILYQQVDA